MHPAGRSGVEQSHVHTGQVERYDVMAGMLKVVEKGREHLLGPGETMEVPAGVAHRQVPGNKAPDGHVRVQVRPAGSTQAFLERVADMCAAGATSTASASPSPSRAPAS